MTLFLLGTGDAVDACYTVGQVLYVIVKGRQQLLPMQVTEEIRRTTLEGTVVRYAVRAGRAIPIAGSSCATEQEFELDARKHEAFASAEVARSALKERAARQVDALIDEAVDLAQHEFKSVHVVTPDLSNESSEERTHTASGDEVMVELPGRGPTKARVRVTGPAVEQA
jgi:hypothetical protein